MPAIRKSTRSLASSATTSRVATPDPLSKPTRGRPRKGKAVVKDEIPDSDEPESSNIASSGVKSQFTVVIPTFHPTKLPPRARRIINRSKSTSIADSTELSDYETPSTSVATTPAETEHKPVPARISATARAEQLRNSRLAMSHPGTFKKRSRSAAKAADFISEADDDVDAKIAAELQAQEYDIDETDIDIDFPSSKRRKNGRASAIEIPDSDGVDKLSDSDIEIPLAQTRRNRLAIGKGRRMRARSPTEDVAGDYELGSSAPFFETSNQYTSREEMRKAGGKLWNSTHKPDEAVDASEGSPLTPIELLDEDEELSSESVYDDDGSSMAAESGGEESADNNGYSRTSASVPPQRVRAYAEHKKDRRAKKEREKLERQHPNIKTMWNDLSNVPPIKPVAANQPAGINRKLKGFQLEGLDWMIKQEKTGYRGGLLGDEMGMGKTIQACSLIMSDFPAKSPTLVVVPPVALMQWQSEITDYTSGQLKVLVYHISANPKCKNLGVKDLKKYNVIMVSYAGLESMYRKENKGWNRHDGIVKEDSLLHAIHYHRVILDEAHSIKSRTTGVAKACFALKADYKWCLSGTPVQNRIGEFFSLLRFLDVKPFACYFCKACKCAELHWGQDELKMCKKCKHSGFSHVSVFNQEILNPITSGESDAIRKAGFAKLRLITDRIMLRRLKRDHTSSMELPPKEIIIHNEFFGEFERDFSQSIMSNSTRKFDTYVSQGVMLNNYANIFGLIMQMRQVANHPDLILRRNAEGGQNILVCCICDEPAEEAIRSRCRHEFCRQCAKNFIRSFDGSKGDADCPSCHIPLVIDWDQPDIEQDEENVKKSSIINRIKMEDWTSSTKIEMLVYDLYKLRSKKQTHKSIVFSQFTSMLQLVQWRLQKSGFSTVLLDGSMSPAQRQKSIEYFMNNVDVEVFLVSLKAGGVALNLTEASRVFIIDPWWNPAAEWQSADRCHRIGQRRPCVITRLCIEDSVESRMVLLQEKKANMINGTINNDQVAMDKLTPEDMQFLFRGS